MKFPLRYFFLSVQISLLMACAERGKPASKVPTTLVQRPKNIILLIGDGMATPQVSAAVYWRGVGRSVWERFPVVGFHQSHALDERVTDSAASATAFACGQKTKNGAIGLVPPDTPCRTILEELSDRGWATGIVVTCSATHATPASFIAHQEFRAFTDHIAEDYLKTRLDCFIGGGKGFFDDRYDRRNLLDSLRQRGYVIRFGLSMNRLPLDGSAPFYLFTAHREPPGAHEGRRYLPYATALACQYLQKRSPKGFFLMVEGSQIDWALHANDARWLKAELLDFDAAVAAALRFAQQNGETLVIATGDHECGGMSLNPAKKPKQFEPAFTSRLHSAAMVPVFAYGPQASLFSGVYDNTDIYFKMWEALGENRRATGVK
ncbi:MAG: alkaline phosphatase [Saprospiraceae bacterium]|nr:alkaline phosphatase [Saprospiraceae bacterium]MDW8482869.1 alkaline phosphatase [Saprospiraceae bacterium]